MSQSEPSPATHFFGRDLEKIRKGSAHQDFDPDFGRSFLVRNDAAGNFLSVDEEPGDPLLYAAGVLYGDVVDSAPEGAGESEVTEIRRDAGIDAQAVKGRIEAKDVRGQGCTERYP